MNLYLIIIIILILKFYKKFKKGRQLAAGECGPSAGTILLCSACDANLYP